MLKNRIAIPAKIREQVLREFNHRCAMCGTDKPQVDHIDEDPSHNDPMNLLPLCPNCHLTDRHNPTAPLEPARLALFRIHKDPTILRPEFEPLFQRLRFLDSIEDADNIEELRAKAKELCEFVASLEMGAFYNKQIEKLTKYPAHVYQRRLEGPDPQFIAEVQKHHQEYQEQLRSERGKVFTLAVELLRYQPWAASKEKRS
jgi:hypothetical protein